MIRERFHRHPKTNRATELDPATFAHPEEFQALECGLDWFVIGIWIGALALGAAVLAAIFYAVLAWV